MTEGIRWEMLADPVFLLSRVENREIRHSFPDGLFYLLLEIEWLL